MNPGGISSRHGWPDQRGRVTLRDVNTTIAQYPAHDLEGLCTLAYLRHRVDRLIPGRGSEGIERLELQLKAQAFSVHRHGTYAIGLTLAGVQTFRYRGGRRNSLP